MATTWLKLPMQDCRGHQKHLYTVQDEREAIASERFAF
jgi:hypothetical protein